MTKSQNTKNEQHCIKQNEKSFIQKDLSLTELWQKGELPDGWYYCYVNNEEYKKLYYDGDCFELEDAETKNYYFFLPKDSDNVKVLAPVPTFEEWKASEKYIKSLEEKIKIYERIDKQHTNDSIAYNELAEENQKLKDLLKEVLRHELSLKEISELSRKISEVLK